jgi:hypothetical protein
MTDHEITLPEEIAKYGIYFGSAAGNEKVVVTLGEGKHLTIHFGTKSGVLDIHITNENETDPDKKWKTLFKIRHYALYRMLVHMKRFYPYILRKHWLKDRITIGKLKHYNCILESISGKPEYEERFFRIQNKGRKVRFKDQIKFNISELYCLPDDLLEDTGEMYRIQRIRNGRLRYQGMLMRNNTLGKKTFYFISKKNFNAFHKALFFAYFNCLNKVEFDNKKETMKYLAKLIIHRYPHALKKKPA